MSNSEEWRPIPGYEFHDVSDQGRVRSWILSQKYKTRRTHSPKILKPGRGSNGYPTVSLHGKTHTVHSLVMRTFVGPPPEGHEICHNNGDRSDARLQNLRYGSHIENVKDTFLHGTDNRGERCGLAKLTWEKVREARQLYAVGDVSYSKLAKLYGVDPSGLRRAILGHTWKEV